MTTIQWGKIKWFKMREFDSPDLPGSGIKMKWELVSRLDAIREQVGFPMIVNSGYRTAAYNATVGGVDGSAHTEGLASDIACRTSQERFDIIDAALTVGITRIGIGKTFIHLDVDPTKPSSVIWLY